MTFCFIIHIYNLPTMFKKNRKEKKIQTKIYSKKQETLKN